MSTPMQSLMTLARATGAGRLEDETMELYLREIAGMDSRDVDTGCRELARTSQWFPKLADVLKAISVARERRIALTALRDDPKTLIKCRDCEDVGFLIKQCPGNDARICGRPDKLTHVKNPETGQYSHSWGPCRSLHTFAERCRCKRTTASVK